MAQPILSIYDLDHLWVTANLEETSFSEVYLGQKVHIYVDSYGGKKFDGKIIQLGSNTAGHFFLYRLTTLRATLQKLLSVYL